MPINFDALPTEASTQLIPAGIYKARVVKADMRTPSDSNKKPYLNMQLQLTGKHGTVGTIFDALYDSDSQAMLYKLGQFVRAAGIPITGSCELRDLAKVVMNRQFCVEVHIEPDNRDKDNRDKDRSRVKLFGSEIYWDISKYEELTASTGEASDPAPAQEGSDDDFDFTVNGEGSGSKY